MNRKQEREAIRQARIDIIFENLDQKPLEEIGIMALSAEANIIGEDSVQQAMRFLFQHPSVGGIGEYERFSPEDIDGRDLHLNFNEGTYPIRSADVQIKSGIAGVKKFRAKVRDYLRRHVMANPTEEDIDIHLARRRLLVLNPRSGYIKFMASFEEQMERICEVAVPE